MFNNLCRADASNALDAVHTIRGATASLRQILTNPSSVTLRALRDRVRQQAPSAASGLHPDRRASTSQKVDHSLIRFYQIALELLDDAAASHASIAYVDMSSTVAAVEAGEEATPSASTSKTNPLPAPTYALHQHLPTGDYFTSAAWVTRADLQSLPKGLLTLASNVVLTC